MSFVLQNFDIKDFLENYWQKKPLLIRNAFAHFETLISPEELAGLACEEDVFSRLLIEKHGAKPWQLVNGPFTEEDFLNLPETHYSLLVSECEKWIPELTELVDQFKFIPQWRIDDLMISYAPEHGSVGPHIDQYDVFLLQAHGQRHWHIQSPESQDNQCIEGLDVAILKDFQHDQDWVLNPGDMLYLPPALAHHGIALNPCMTYSIGFRAPSSKELLEGVITTLSHKNLITDTQRYTDSKLTTERHTAEITKDDVSQVQHLINNALKNSENIMAQVTGEVMTQKSLDLDLACNDDYNVTDRQEVMHHPDALFAYHSNPNELLFFANGHTFHLNNDLLETVQFISTQRTFNITDIPNAHYVNAQTLIENLIKRSLLLI